MARRGPTDQQHPPREVKPRMASSGRARWLVPGGAPVFPRPCIGRMATRRSRSFALEQRAVKVHLELGQPVDIMGIHLYAGPVPEIVPLAGMI